MKINKSVLFLLVVIATIIIPTKTFAQSDYEKQTAAFSIDLAKKIKESNKTKVAVSDFLDNDGNLTELGKAIAEDIGVGIVNEGKGAFQVMERSNLNAILKEQKLSSTGLIDPETAKQLGKLKMVDAVIVGNITPFGNSFRVTIKILDTETGMSIAAAAGNLAGTDDIKGLFNKKITVSGSTSQTIHTDSSTVNSDSKTVKCYNCNGNGTISVKGSCIDCKGTGRISCFQCNGSGRSNTSNAFACDKCTGKGYTNCKTCNGKKIVSTTEICSICNGIGENNPGIAVNSSFSQIIANENAPSKDIQGCETKNTGDYCFTNNSNRVMYVTVYIPNKGTSGEISLDIGQAQCYNSLEATTYDYVIGSKRWSWYMSDAERNGKIEVEKCKSKTFIIR